MSVLLVLPASGQYFGKNRVQYEEFDFRTLETEHFIFHYYPAEEEAVRDAARMAERWYDRHTQVFLHDFDEKKPIIFYANDVDFQQTNVAQQPVGPGTGGFTEALRERVVMPFSASYGETDHVLGHELVHSFQYDLGLNADSLEIQLDNIPTWLVEGMAEYLSVGRRSSHTAMWMRDAVRREAMPTFEELSNAREYFPYRYGQAYLAYIAGKYGDRAVTDLFKRGGQVGLDSAYVELFGVEPDSLTEEWGQATRDAYRPLMEDRTPPDSIGTPVLSPSTNGGEINISPSLSPDGQYVAFISERELFSFNLYVADAETGDVIADLDPAGTTRHFNALRFINSSGTWSPDGQRLAFVSTAEGDDQLTIWNVEEEEIEQTVRVEGVAAMKNPAWSPEGTRIAFSGTDGGVSDLYVLDRQTEAVRQLTDDRYADLQPTWAPDGETIAFATDREETNLELLASSSNMDIGLIDVDNGTITVREPFGDALHHNPQFSPDGQSLYFISDQDGFKDVYHLDRSDGSLQRVTHLKTGVSGITAMSPALSVAAQSGDMMLSIFSDGEYTGVRLDQEEVRDTRLARTTDERTVAREADTVEVDPPGEDTTDVEGGGRTAIADTSAPAGILPPYSARNEGIVASSLDDPRSGLPPATADFEVGDYDPSLSLEMIAPPRAGVSIGGRSGATAGGGIGFRFGDMLGHQTLTVTVQAQGTLRDIGGGVSYINRRGQLNWGGGLNHSPHIFGANDLRFGPRSGVSVIRRAYVTSGHGLISYPLDQTRRFDLALGTTRYGFGVQVREIGFEGDLSIEDLNRLLREEEAGFQFPEGRDPVYLANGSLAYVRDFSTTALTGPVRGGRWRLEVAPTVGTQNFVTARADVRRYLYAFPFTLALQGLHVGNYGAEFGNELGIGNEYIGYPYGRGFVRGYNVRSISNSIRENGGCTPVAGDATRSQCAEIDRLFGTRSLTARAELRVPLFGPERFSLIPFRYLPTTLGVFADAGVAWTEGQRPRFAFETESPATNIPVVSTGVTARFNVLGSFLLETYVARPFQRRDMTWTWGLRLQPGF